MRDEYEIICKKYYNRVYLFIFKMCGNKELTEDLTQETFYQTFRSLHRYRGRSDMFTYIASIAKHMYFKHLKKDKHFGRSVDILDISDFLTDDGALNPEYIYEQTSEKLKVRELIGTLPDKYRDVILYRIYADMTFSQVAETMNITENSAKVLFFRAKKKLSEELTNGDYL